LLQGMFTRSTNFLGVMETIPQLGCNEEVFTFYDTLINFRVDTFTNFMFVFVNMSTINMSIAGVDCILDSQCYFTFWRLYEIQKIYFIKTMTGVNYATRCAINFVHIIYNSMSFNVPK
jgi:hypothetical protein